MLTWFRKRGARNFGVYGKRFDTVILKKGQDKRAVRLAQFLSKEGILSRVEKMIVLNQDLLGNYGVHYAKQNELSFGKGFSRLVEKWLRHVKDTS